jgi:hypothetical protein
MRARQITFFAASLLKHDRFLHRLTLVGVAIRQAHRIFARSFAQFDVFFFSVWCTYSSEAFARVASSVQMHGVSFFDFPVIHIVQPFHCRCNSVVSAVICDRWY